MIGQWVGARRRRTKRALKAARMLDEVVDTQLPLLASFDEDRRRRSADYLAELVKLAQDYRYFAHGWIDAKELDRRGHRAVATLGKLRADPTARLITD
ncbi:hypothetical protein ABZ816_33075 [Actinosynnema sp. NPDC047251]|uniref:Uncharacterized protein n=1 Tax=Saccharothrix espanaensis (strain ATCC 51144 / DSM 44229 / JCM 9112 / NBRC 15066 / NRRL 15764) TaxID=1179773 RepID=K0JPQ3_SACES|nr:hypothetical protein [Saccharothrix espanaensis]CCH27376.1 hypothetical protein BN6_00440 [Saccharothrix espanaensis DSM 44229]